MTEVIISIPRELENEIRTLSRLKFSLIIANMIRPKLEKLAKLKQIVSKPFKTGCKKWRYSKAYERNCIIYGLKQKNIPPWLLLDRWLRPHWFYPKYYPIYVDLSELEGEYFYCKEGGLTYPNDGHWNGTLVLIVDHGTCSAAVDTTEW